MTEDAENLAEKVWSENEEDIARKTIGVDLGLYELMEMTLEQLESYDLNRD